MSGQVTHHPIWEIDRWTTLCHQGIPTAHRTPHTVTCGNCKRIMGSRNARPPSPSPDQVLAERGAVWMTYAQVISRTPNPPLHVSTWDQVWNRTARERLIDRAVRSWHESVVGSPRLLGCCCWNESDRHWMAEKYAHAIRAEFARLSQETAQ